MNSTKHVLCYQCTYQLKRVFYLNKPGNIKFNETNKTKKVLKITALIDKN